MSLGTGLQPYANFTEASRAVLEFLHEYFDFAIWLLTRTEEDEQIVLDAQGGIYPVAKGDVLVWHESFCAQLIQGAPNIAPDITKVPAYASTLAAKKHPIKAYIGLPLVGTGGDFFGTLCAYNPEIQSNDIKANQQLIETLGRLLSTQLEYDLKAQIIERELELIKNESYYDALTELYNQRAWLEFIQSEEDRASRYGHRVSVAMIDLDNLKKVNDSEGHLAGDALIKRAATVLKQSVRSTDRVARIGGDEFAILLPEIATQELDLLMKRIELNLSAQGLHASMGWATRQAKSGLAETIKLADLAMYANKTKRKAQQLQAR